MLNRQRVTQIWLGLLFTADPLDDGGNPDKAFLFGHRGSWRDELHTLSLGL